VKPVFDHLTKFSEGCVPEDQLSIDESLVVEGLSWLEALQPKEEVLFWHGIYQTV
jgi:hypothetical protein